MSGDWHEVSDGFLESTYEQRIEGVIATTSLIADDPGSLDHHEHLELLVGLVNDVVAIRAERIKRGMENLRKHLDSLKGD